MAHVSKSGSAGGGSSTLNAIFLMLKGFIGTGILFLPKAFLHGGLLGSLILLILMAAFSMWGMWLLFNASLVIPGSYQDVMGQLYGSKVKTIVMVSLTFCQYGLVMVYMLFVGSNLRDLVATLTDCRYEFNNWILLLAVQLIAYIPLVLIRKIEGLSKFAFLANIFMITGIFYVLYCSFVKIVHSPAKFSTFNDLSNTTLFLGTAIFTFEGFGLVIPISQSMKDPRKFGLVLVFTIIVVTMLCVLIGVLGLIAFGSLTETVILLNMPNNIYLQVIQILYIVAIMLSLPLQFFPAVEILEAPFFGKHPNESYRSLYRVFLTIVATCGAYIGASSLDVFTSFIGGFCAMPICFIYPPMAYLRSCARTKFQKYSSYVLLAIGVVLTIFASSIAFHKLLFDEKEVEINRCQ